MTLESRELELHGQRVSYRTAGSGPALLLLHGIANSSETWERVAPLLSERFTLIAPDLMGHGESATPRGDYSLGAHASGARDIADGARARAHDGARALARRRHRDAVRLPVPRARGAPGARLERRARPRGAPAAARRLAARRRLRAARAHLAPGCSGSGATSAACSAARAAPRRRPRGARRAASSSLDNAGSRQAFLHTVRAVIEPGGQRVSANEPARASPPLLPTLIVWGERDSIIPVGTATRPTRRCPAAGSSSSTGRATCPTTTIPTASPRS